MMRIVPAEPLHLADIVSIEQMVQPVGWSAKAFEEELNEPHPSFVVFFEEQLSGYVFGQIHVDHGEVMNLAVAPLWQRRGAGKALLQTLLKADHAASIPWFLEVRVHALGAIALYEQLGFERIALRRGYFDRGASDALLMKKPPAAASF
jgi:[ribosomal protein S18]-alanine N-acetyltransferase